jgi:hypothetical protein
LGHESLARAGDPLAAGKGLTPARRASAGALFALVVYPGARAQERLPIESIEIKTFNVFTPDEAAKAFFPYRLANAIHIESRKSFIASELTFRLGDPLDPEKLAETERNLRALSLFRAVAVRSQGPNVTVQTFDAWTLLLRGNLSRRGGATAYSLGVEESNLLGTGMGLSFDYENDVDRTTRNLAYSDPSFFAPYTLFNFTASDSSDGKNVAVGLARPFYALDVDRMEAASYRQTLSNTRLYAGGVEVARWKERLRNATANGGFLLSLGGDSAVRFLGSVEWSDVALLSAVHGPPPPLGARRFLFLMAGLEREGRHWIERRQVDKMDRDEDFNLAPSARLEIGASPGVSGGEPAGRLRGQGRVGALLPSGLALATASFDTRVQAQGLEAGRLTADIRAYLLRENVTIAGRVGVVAGWRLDPEQQIELDGENGVRGYHLHAVAGTGHFVANVESRFFLFSDLLQLLSIGVAAFGDAGVSWGAPDNFQRLADLGLGLRFGLTRASKTSVIRVDVARALHADPLGRTGWLLSFSSGQAF